MRTAGWLGAVAKSGFVAAAAWPLLSLAASADDNSSMAALRDLSIDELANVQIYSVSKSAQPLSDAAAAIFVISRDDIHRTGARTLPEMLRLAPNLVVAQVSGSGYAITARGFNGTTTTNGAGNKLLVLIDGRTVYSPLYAGVFWDLQSVPPEDIERIEVISGPGATLWGANAVNGVINIITRKASETQGLSVSGGVGSMEKSAGAQYGGALGDDASYRVYGNAFRRNPDETTAGVNAKDGWSKLQAGFRLDWKPGSAAFTLQGDIFRGAEEQAAPPNAVIGGHNLLARWQQPFEDGSAIQVQAYYDYNTLYVPGSLGDSLRTYDLDVQHSFSWGRTQDFVWGGGVRLIDDAFTNTPDARFLPAKSSQWMADAFLQDSIALTGALNLTLGTKLESDPYVALQVLPSARLSWKLGSSDLLWAAVSRAVRAPTRWDRDLSEDTNGFTLLAGGHFQSEQLTAYEIGYRAQPLPGLSFSLSAYYNVYKGLRSVELNPVTVFPLNYANLMEGKTYGGEFWASYDVLDWWRVSTGVNLEQEDLRFKPASIKLPGLQIAGNDPAHQVLLRSSWDLPWGLQFDIDGRAVGALPNPVAPAYIGLNARLGWHATDQLELALSGENLAGAHSEFGPVPGGTKFEPNVLLTMQWKP